MFSIVAQRHKDLLRRKEQKSIESNNSSSSKKKYLSITSLSKILPSQKLKENDSQLISINVKVLQNMTNRPYKKGIIMVKKRKISQLTTDTRQTQNVCQKGVKDRMRQFKKRLTNLQDVLDDIQKQMVYANNDNPDNKQDMKRTRCQETPINKLLQEKL